MTELDIARRAARKEVAVATDLQMDVGVLDDWIREGVAA